MERMITDFDGAGVAWNGRIGPIRRRDRDGAVALGHIYIHGKEIDVA